MKRYTIFWTPFALARLDEIYDYISEEAKSTTPAKKLTEKIIERTSQLSDFPESGQAEGLLKAIGQQSRYLAEGNYKIIYQYEMQKNLIIITDVFHTKQNPKKLS